MKDNVPAINITTFQNLRELMGENEFQEIIHFFYQDSNEAIQALRQALEQEDARQIGVISHKLKSSAQLLGALPMAKHARELEQQRETFDVAQARQQLLALQQSYVAASGWISQHYTSVTI